MVFGAFAYWLVGFGLSYGQPSNPFCGMGDFALSGDPYSSVTSGLAYSQYIFQFSFAATATTIVSGAVSMRMRFFIYCLYSFFAIIIYSFVAHWLWADDGWLLTLGVHDFAGGGPVHLLGGMNALVAIKMVGSRTGYFTSKAHRERFIPASPASTLFGLFMLWWGWIGFNCGSTFGITGNRWIVASRAAIITINCTAGGGIASMIYTQWKTRGKLVRPHHVVNGILGALVASSPVCASVHPYDALIIGAVGSVVANLGNTAIKRLKLDDPVGAVGVHAFAAMWGIFAVGLFADGDLPGNESMTGLFRGGGFRLLGVQVLEIVVIVAWSLVCAGSFFYTVGVIKSKNWRDPRRGLRVGVQVEMMGEDRVLHGVNQIYDQPDAMSIRFTSDENADVTGDDHEAGAKDGIEEDGVVPGESFHSHNSDRPAPALGGLMGKSTRFYFPASTREIPVRRRSSQGPDAGEDEFDNEANATSAIARPMLSRGVMGISSRRHVPSHATAKNSTKNGDVEGGA